MKITHLKKITPIAVLILAILSINNAQTANLSSRTSIKSNRVISRVEEKNVRAQMEFLASDAMQGRGSGTQFELLAGLYIASQLQQFGVEPAGDADASGKKTYIQTANIELKGNTAAPQMWKTWNVVGKLTGRDSRLSAEVILLSAHMDHIGVKADAPGEDKIRNGADDDASGCVAVLELARYLARGNRPKRTVYFVFFGSEENGLLGSKYFADNLPFPKDKFIANLQFEMIGRPDAKIAANELWLTGFERSNLGSELAKQGAKLVRDPYPAQNLFTRSDNYSFAKQGIIAHTVSSFGFHKDYHQVTDEVKTIDFNHLIRAIDSMIKPVEWLVNSNFKPTWNEGQKP